MGFKKSGCDNPTFSLVLFFCFFTFHFFVLFMFYFFAFFISSGQLLMLEPLSSRRSRFFRRIVAQRQRDG